MNMVLSYGLKGLSVFDRVGEGVGPLVLRLLLAFEFWESGVEKFHGANWFADIQSAFPFPLNLVPVDISWFLATWFELIGAIALAVGFGTRFFAFSLAFLTIVAIMSVHGAHGYNVCDNGFKLPLIYLVMFVPLIFQGGGALSLDRLFFARRQG